MDNSKLRSLTLRYAPSAFDPEIVWYLLCFGFMAELYEVAKFDEVREEYEIYIEVIIEETPLCRDRFTLLEESLRRSAAFERTEEAAGFSYPLNE
jgi:hypothetical protein